MATVRCRRPAMATWFEAWLVGDDPEHLSAVGEAALDEVDRIERLLSRHDPAAELARVNREAAGRAVRIDGELFAVLVDCLGWFERTQGAFDIGRASPRAGAGEPPPPLPERLVLSAGRCSARFTDDALALDLGGYGKGYALDAAARIVEEFGVGATLVHGGTSSVLARGKREDGRPWQVGIADPFDPEEPSVIPISPGPPKDSPPATLAGRFWSWERPRRADEALHAPDPVEVSSRRRAVAAVDLVERSLSTSAVRHPRAATSDLVDPETGRPLDEPAACVVLAPRALEAEVLSTALLVMGEARARRFLAVEELLLPPELDVGWIGLVEGRTSLRWIAGGG